MVLTPPIGSDGKVTVTSTDFNLADDQSFINFDVTTHPDKADEVNAALLKTDYKLDRSDDPNVIDFGLDPTLTFFDDVQPDGTQNTDGTITDDFTLMYYQGNYSLFDL
jgi:hypothetical protein